VVMSMMRRPALSVVSVRVMVGSVVGWRLRCRALPTHRLYRLPL
jgi:hypothetical protein